VAAGLAQGARGLVDIAYHLPGQAWRTYQMLPESDRAALRKRLPFGAYEEDSLARALPFIVAGIVLVIGYNILRR